MSHRNDRALTVGSLSRVEGEGAMHVHVVDGRVSDVRSREDGRFRVPPILGEAP